MCSTIFYLTPAIEPKLIRKMDELSPTTDEKWTNMEPRPHTVEEWVSAICRNLNYLAMAPDCPVEQFSVAFLSLCFWDSMQRK